MLICKNKDLASSFLKYLTLFF